MSARATRPTSTTPGDIAGQGSARFAKSELVPTRRRRISHRAFCLVSALILLLALPKLAHAAGESLRLDLGRETPRVGIPFVIAVEAKQFGEPPSLQVPSVPGLGVRSLGRPNVSKSFRQIGSRRTIETMYSYRFAVFANQPGTFTLGPFEAEVDGRTISTTAPTITVSPPLDSSDLQVRMILPDRPLVVGESAPVAIEISMPYEDNALVRSLNNRFRFYLSVPAFDEIESLGFKEIERREDEGDYFPLQVVRTAGGGDIEDTMALMREGERNGIRQRVFRLERTIAPRATGKFELAPCVVSFEKGTNWRRGAFNRYSAGRRVWLQKSDIRRTLEVVDFPADPPESFASGVGDDFQISVTADRSVVKEGEPIRLRISIRGDGNLDTAGLGPLSADGGLGPDDFHLPRGGQAGLIQEDGSKMFEVVVRPRHPRVTSIPGVAYSWYDPSVGRYETTRSDPIALSVGQGTVVGAADLEGGSPSTEDNPSADFDHNETSPPNTPGEQTQVERRERASRLANQDLSIQTDARRLLNDGTGSGSRNRSILIALYSTPFLFLLLALAWRRYSSVDPAYRAFEKQRSEAIQSIKRLQGRPAREGLEEIANEIRRIWRDSQGEPRSEIEAFLAECDTLAFAPGSASDSSTLSTEVVERGIALVRRMQTEGTEA